MRMGIIITVALIAAAAFAGDINPVGDNVCGAGGIRIEPATIVTGDQFKKIYDNLDAKLSDAEVAVISTDDDNWWTYDNDNHKPWDYMLLAFIAPDGYTSGTCYWQVKLASQGVVTVWYWDHRPWGSGGQRFVYCDANHGGSNPPTEDFSVPASYFNDDGVMWLLIQGLTAEDQWTMSCDVCDIHY